MHHAIARETPNGGLKVKKDYKNQNTVVLAGVLSVASLMIFGLTFTTENTMPPRNNFEQSDFSIDAHYYYYLGNRIKDVVSVGMTSLFEAVVDMAPNPSTVGVIFLSTILSYLFGSIIQVKFFLFTLFSILITYLRAKNVLRRYSEFFLLGGLFPYLFLPSKECFFILGLLIYLTRYGTSLHWLPSISGLILMLLARPEGAVILIFVLMLRRSAITRLIVITGGAAAYILFLREPLIEFSVLFELSAESAGTHFCNIGPFSLCVAGAGIPELVFIQRLFVNLFLPLDWIRDFVVLFANPENFTNFDISIRTASLFHILLLAPVIIFPWSSRKVKNFSLLSFPVGYYFIYSSLLFFQSSRQIIFATTILFILTRVRSDILKVSPSVKKYYQRL